MLSCFSKILSYKAESQNDTFIILNSDKVYHANWTHLASDNLTKVIPPKKSRQFSSSHVNIKYHANFNGFFLEKQ